MCSFNMCLHRAFLGEVGPERERDGGKSSLPSEVILVITLLPLNKSELLLREGNSWERLFGKLGIL